MDTYSFDLVKNSKEAFKTSMNSRGGIIDFAVNIENTLTDIIAWCFYPTEKEWDVDIPSHLDKSGILLKSTLLRKLEFSEKIDTLRTVITARNLLPMTQYNKNLLTEIKNNLHHIRRFRNLLAHSPLDLSPDSLKSLTYKNPGQGTDDFQLIEYKQGKAIKHKIHVSLIKSEVLIMMKCWYQLIQLFALLKGDIQDAKVSEILSNMSEEDTNDLLKNLGFID
jgi:hypothetical protein